MTIPTAAWAYLTAAAAHAMPCPVAAALDLFGPLPDAAAADSAALMRRAEADLLAARYPQAEAGFRRALAADPGHTQAQVQLALLASDQGARGRALRHWLAVAAAWPHLGQPFFEVARLYAAAGEADRAQAWLRRLPGPVTDAYWIAEIRRIGQERDQIVQAVRARLAARRGGLPAEDCADLAAGLARLGWVRLANRLLDTLPATPATALARFQCARRGDPDAALDALLRDIPPPDRTPPLRLVLAEALFQADRLAEAAQLLAADAADPQAGPLLFRIQWARGEGASALALAGQMMDRQPDQTAPCQFALAALLALGRLPVASGDKAAPADPASPIPPVILQYWDQPVVPDDVQAVMQQWRAGAAWHGAVFDAEAARHYIAGTCPPDHRMAFDRCHHAAMRSDYFRLCYLAREGGVYIDVDEAPQGSPDALLRAMQGCDLLVAMLGTALPYTNNALIAARPNHPVLLAALAEATGRLCSLPPGTRPDIWQTTGPGLLTRNWVRHVRDHGPAGLRLLTEPAWRQLCVPQVSLAYKATESGNWRLAT